MTDMQDAASYTHGAERQPDGRVRFRLWAPGSGSVVLHVGGEALSMPPQGEGWFEAVHACAPGAAYWFEPAGHGRVPDPASRLQADDVDGASIVVDHDAYVWRHPEWRGRPWHETVFYEAHVGLLGGFDGVRRRLPALADLGITALELMPIAEFPGSRNWGYDGVLPYAPERAYGTPDALKALVDAAHGLGIMVFLDVVYNHFGPVGNGLPSYAPDYFRDDVTTPWGPAIDFRSAPVRAYFAENALYWLKEYRFDGLRFDAVHAIVDKEAWLGDLAVWLRNALPPGRFVHLVLENDDNTASLLRHGYDAQWNDDAHHVVHHLLTGEAHGYYAAYAQRPTDKLARALAQGFIYQGEPSPVHDGRPRGEPSSMLAPTSFIFFLQNHDQVGNRAHGERLAVLCRERPEALRAAVALQLLCPAIPLLFMGEEQGAETPFLYFTSFADAGFAAAVAEGRRAEFAAFHEEGVQAIPDPNAESSWNASRLPSAEGDAARGWLDFYRELLMLRRRHVVPGLKGCACESVRVAAEGCVIALWALGDGRRLVIYCNVSDQPATLDGAAPDTEETLFYESRGGAAASLLAGIVPAHCTLAGLRPPGPPAEAEAS